MAIYLMDKTYRIATVGGVGAYRAVVQGPVSGQCALPAAANAGAVLGVTVHSQPTAGRGVTVRKAGIAECIAAGPIAAGEPVNIAGTTGKVKAIDEASDTKVNCVGFAETAASADGDVVEVFLAPHERLAP